VKIIILNTLGNGFIFNYIPTYIYKRSLSILLKKKTKIEKLLKDNFNYTLEQFIEEYKKAFSIKKFGKYYIISIKQNINIEKIIRAIDYGIIGFKPQHIFDKTFKYVNNNIQFIYNMWLHNIDI